MNINIIEIDLFTQLPPPENVVIMFTNWLVFVNGTLAFFNTMLLLCRKLTADIFFVNVDGYDNHSYADVETKMKGTIDSLDPNSVSLPWALFFGWDPELIPDLPRLSKEVLNEFSTEIPICVIGQSGHVAWVNQKAFDVS